jgi:hypothetical protein
MAVNGEYRKLYESQTREAAEGREEEP